MLKKNCIITLVVSVILASASYISVNAQTQSADTDYITVEELLDMPIEDLIKVRVVTIATGAKQTVSKAPATASVISAEDIEAIGATSLDEILATVPGLHVSRSGVLNAPTYSIRGMRSLINPEVLMLVNGIPVTATFMEERRIISGSMPINMISQIEVIRGPGSAVYGANAFSGVINIITKTKEDIKGTEVGARLGSFNTYEGWVLHGDKWEGCDIAAGLEYRKSNGQDSILQEDAQTQFDKLYGTHVSLAPGPVNMGIDNLETRLDIKRGFWQARAGYQGRHHLGTGPGLGQALEPTGYLDLHRTNADLTYHNPTLTSYWDVTSQWSYLDQAATGYFVIYPPGAMGGTYPDGFLANTGYADRALSLDTFAFYSGFPKHQLRIGAGYSHFNQYKVTDSRNFGVDSTGQPLPLDSPMVSVTDTPYAFNKKVKRNSQYLSLQDVWTMADQWELTAGIRYDNYSDFGQTVNPRLALVWQPQRDFTTKLLYGRAFRAPGFNEMYNANNPVNLGNPDLKPEIINTWEWAFDYQVEENWQLAVNLFHYKVTDKIQLAATSTSGASAIMSQNVGILEGNGLELETRWKMSTKNSWLAHYSYAKAMNKTANHDAGDYPRHTAYLRTDWLLIPNWHLDVQAKWIADRQRTVGDPRPPVADYTTVDLTLRYKNIQGGRTNIALSVRNLFNADAREPSLGPDSSGMISIPYDLPLAKRNWFVELRYRF